MESRAWTMRLLLLMLNQKAPQREFGRSLAVRVSTPQQGTLAPKCCPYSHVCPSRGAGWERLHIYLSKLAFKLQAAFQITDLFSSQDSYRFLISWGHRHGLKLMSKCQNPQNKPQQHRYQRICAITAPSTHAPNTF